ncbi:MULTISPECIES: PepSY domain-containing protein [unclassified Xanthobacter]|uniref:PepSY domain-containing protein n=1 Tax=unclassified Xanthobacter TaxID=2623496 RepID=UPI001EE02A6E|nr:MULTISPECIES: PepSY domain-containing protein [unclassified Xanthobacter]
MTRHRHACWRAPTVRAFAVALALTAPLTLPAWAQTPAPGRSTAAIATHIAENGFHVLKLEREATVYEAELVSPQGNLVEARIDPVSAAFLSTKMDGRAGPLPDQWLTVAQIARHLEGQGYTVRKIEAEATGYEVELTDRAGARTEADIDPMTGAIRHSKPD